jgi:copper chaperone CopZ
MKKIQLTISGMSCQNCVKSVTNGLYKVPGVQDVIVKLDTGIATVKGDDSVSEEALREAIADRGFEVTGVQPVE